MSDKERKYKFNWNLVEADYDDARPGLGASLRLEAYRLFQFAMRDVLEEEYSTEVADEIFRKSGVVAGRAFFTRYCTGITDVAQLAKRLQEVLRELGIGIMRFEKIDLEKLEIQMTVDEDLDCSGLPDTHEQICVYDEGFLQGILEQFTGKPFVVREIDCWCTGERTCRFNAKVAIDTAATGA